MGADLARLAFLSLIHISLLLGGEMVKPGVSTKQIDDKIRHYIEKCGAKPSFLGYGGFPGSACISINQEIKMCIRDSPIREETVSRTERPEHPEKLKKEELTNVTAER